MSFAYPPLSSLVDEFAGTSLDAPWFLPNGDNCVAQASGSLVATPPANADNYCIAYAQGDWHLTCDSLTFELPQVTSPVLGVQTVLYLDSGSSDHVLDIILEAGGLQWSGSTNLGTYDAVAERWWRLRELDGTLYFETSPDGTTFATRGSMPDPGSLDDVHPDIGAGTYKNVASPGAAAFRCFNSAPPCQ